MGASAVATSLVSAVLARRMLAIMMTALPIDVERRRLYRSRANPDERQRAQAGQVLLLVEIVRGAKVIAGCCADAQAAGVSVGMSLAQARALCGPCAHEADWNPPAYAAAHARIALWCMRYSPIACMESSNGPESVIVEITGCERLHGSEEMLLQRVSKEIAQRGIRARVAVASTPAAALAACCDPMIWAPTALSNEQGIRPPRADRAVASAARWRIVRAGHERDELARHPVRALRVSGEVCAALAEVNIKCIGDLAPLARPDLALRFGTALLVRMDLLDGTLMQPLVPVSDDPPPRFGHAFEGPTTRLESVERALRLLIDSLCAHLSHIQKGAREVEAVFIRLGVEGRSPERIRLRLGAPSASASHLWVLFRPHVERLQMGFGIEEISICAPRCGRIPHSQTYCSTAGDSVSDAQAARLRSECLDVLASRLGRDALLQAQVAHGRDGENAFRLVIYPSRARTKVGPLAALRPTVVHQSEPVRVSRDEHGRPQSMQRGGQVHRVLGAVGPERIEGRWWEEEGVKKSGVRDYWRVQTESGTWLWIWRGGSNWFVQGIWA
ncbi:MAG: DNA polymerase Y family protein [Phycisphaerales bacterium]|nr:DNA polymerase Y family protein [Phycisphaerales bacterium]